MQCRTSGNGDLPLHSLSKGIGFGLLGEHRGASAKCDVARTKCVLCGHRRERKTAFAKVLPELWIVTCDRDGSIARGNCHQGGNARRQVLAKTQLPYLDEVGATLGTNSVRCDDLSKGKDLKVVLRIMSALPPKADMCSALAYVCFGSKQKSPANVPSVGFTPGSGQSAAHLRH
jgi:hypothetical protein